MKRGLMMKNDGNNPMQICSWKFANLCRNFCSAQFWNLWHQVEWRIREYVNLFPFLFIHRICCGNLGIHTWKWFINIFFSTWINSGVFWNLILLKKTIFRQNPHDSASDHSNYVRNWEKSRFKLFNEILESDIWKWIRNKLISRKETNRGVPSYWQNIPEEGREFRIFFLWKMWRFPRNYELDCQIAK